METVVVTILDPDAEAMLDDMASRKLIRLRKAKVRSRKSELNNSEDRFAFYLSGPVMSDEEFESYKTTREWMNKWRTN